MRSACVATRVSAFTFLTPVAGLLFGALITAAERTPAAMRWAALLLTAALADSLRAAAAMVRGILWPGEEWLAVRYGLQSRAEVRRYRLVHPLRVARAFMRGLHGQLGQTSLE